MSQRTFHHRLTLGSLCGLVLFSLLVIYLFWIKLVVLGLLVVNVIFGMIERILHTTYTFIRTKPIDRDEEMEFLLINRGRFSTKQQIALCDVVKCVPMRNNFGLSHYLLIKYGADRLIAVQPQQEQAFMEELMKRQQAEDASFAEKHS